MKDLVTAVRGAVRARQWYPALALALALPDICGYLEAPNEGSKSRYVAWCDRYLVPAYTATVGAERRVHIFLSGEDCYALRCAYLHQGSHDITAQRARLALDSFVFIEPPPNHNIIHRNRVGAALQLQVDLFCEDICVCADQWIREVFEVDPRVQGRAGELLRIKPTAQGFSF